MRIGACLVGLRRAAESTWGLKNAKSGAYDPLLMARYQSEASISSKANDRKPRGASLYIFVAELRNRLFDLKTLYCP